MLELDEAIKKELRRVQKTAKNRSVFVRATVLLMLDKGWSAESIAESLGIDDGTVYRYKQKFELTGLKDYFETHYVGYAGQLNTDQKAALGQELDKFLYISSAAIALFIETEFGIEYTRNGVAKLLKSMGFVYKKSKLIPGKADKSAQEAFLQKIAHLLEKKPENTEIYYNDATHPQHNTRPERGWIRKGAEFEVSSNSGRNRLNLNGAVNAHNPTEIIIQEQSRINSESTIELWETINLKHPHPTTKITHFCDNASYYHSQMVKDWLVLNPRVEVIFLPPYSPNLNLIERLWKFMRKETISSFYRAAFADFRKAVLDFFKNIGQHKQALESLLTLNFRVVSC